MPNHRRSDDNEDLQGHRLQAAVDSTTAKFLARYLVPVLLAWMAWQGKEGLGELKEQRGDIAQMKSDIRVVTTRLDEGVVRQVNNNTQQLVDHEKRLQVIERTVKTP